MSDQSQPSAGASAAGQAATAPAATAQPGGAPGVAPGAAGTILAGASGVASPGSAPAADWRTSLPSDFNNVPALRPFAAFETQAELIEALGKSYIETKSMVGKKLEVPGADATPDQLAAWRKVVGAPDTPDGYGESLKPESFPDDQWSKETEGELRAIAHKHSLPVAAVKDILGIYEKTVTGGLQAAEAQFATQLAAETQSLKKEWGSDFDRQLSLAQRYAATIGLSGDHPIFAQAEVVKAMARGAALISESKLVNGAAVGLPASNSDRARAIMDSKNTETIAREYRNEFGPERQKAAQDVLNSLLGAK